MRALVPMAGEGSRFKQAGYTFPKPLIDVNGKPMIQVVIDTLPKCEEYIFLCRSEHIEEYRLESLLQQATNHKARIIEVAELTEGAACTCLLAKEFIDNTNELIIANSDQYVEYNIHNFNILREHTDASGIIFTFNASHPKWSFVSLNHSLVVDEVAEKVPISDIATCGLYYFRSGGDFVEAAENMIEKNIRTNNEFYLAPVYNELIEWECDVLPFFVSKMHGLGTPEDLERFLKE